MAEFMKNADIFSESHPKMPGLREAGLAGAALALTGGLVYVLWNLRDTKKRREAEKLTLEQNLNAKKQEKLVAKEIRTETACEAPTLSQVCVSARHYHSWIKLLF